MSKLIVVSYDDEFKAEQVRLDFLKMQKSYLVELEDAVVAVKKKDGKVKLRQMNNLAAYGALGGGFWGLLIGAIFLNPLLGFAIGTFKIPTINGLLFTKRVGGESIDQILLRYIKFKKNRKIYVYTKEEK